jgi:PAS domain S-box-containing protein
MPTSILVVEDNEDNLTLIEYLLRSHGYSPVLAHDGPEGVRLAGEERPDLILLDIRMPGMSGYEVATAIRRDHRLDHSRIVAVTASAMVGDRERIAAAGFDGYIQKPIDPETFMDALEPFLSPRSDGRSGREGKAASSILVLDDRAIDRELLVTVLSRIGHTVLEASTGEAALDLARDAQPELIVVDLMMPGMSGPEFVRELRADPIVGATRVVFCTATYDADEVRTLADTAGVSHILTKPCVPDQIISVVTDALGSDAPTTRGIVAGQFDREQMRVLNAKLVQKVSELAALNAEQSRLHEQLRKSQRQTAESLTLLETLQASAPIGIGFVDREFRIRRINEPLAAAHGTSAGEQIDRTVAEVMPREWPNVEHVYRHVLATGEPVLNREAERPDPLNPGESRHLLASYYPVRLGDEVIGIGVVVIDVTERHQADDLRSVVMENIAEGLYVTDAQGRLVYMNPAASRMTGWREDDLRGQSVHAAIHYQHADGTPFAEHDCQLERALTEGRTMRVTDDAFTRSDGTIFRYAGSAAPLLSAAGVRGSVVVFRDITGEHAG